ncbi:hypothetical protein CMQ_643 [Grosmannia clavigera kw1407]|uniref:Uncharacterized protein n=1 Tax=Grosmannia clavigera (strain kw1407 / UAMH 11150) TaxID=655863 RepID=F0XDL0_GROCL|nr:uncharacterized protein CMQ_643 [Grosmannia clavigera kw1407]EFX03715.1 hypothetical protein CMQ_643 [Grosmannia clavigera kw1407]
MEKCTKKARLHGWSEVDKARSRHTSLNNSVPVAVDQFRKSMPNHAPKWTCLGVAILATPGMRSRLTARHTGIC